MSERLEIEGYIRNITYTPCLPSSLPDIPFSQFDTASAPVCGMLRDDTFSLAYSQWVSPKRTRSYPFARMYQTYHAPKKITIVPIIKDEGADGDMDRLQYSTISWLNLLNIYLVLGYYDSASKNLSPKQITKQKLTRQRFHMPSIQRQIEQIRSYHQSALHWNMHLCETYLTIAYNNALEAYTRISEETGVAMHSYTGITSYIEAIQKEYTQFRDLSLKSSQQASMREVNTTHNAEFLSDGEKARLILKNYLGGTYYLTIDEVIQTEEGLILQESKNASKEKLPKRADIQDGLFRLILYSNLDRILVGGFESKFKVRLKLTGRGVDGSCLLPSASTIEYDSFVQQYTPSERRTLLWLGEEARINGFEVELAGNS